ncbi:MAG: recombinase RecT [Halanaerobiales bacterium]|nr:recombinase RecT [Halanaerobiales bacterium]
MTVLQDVDNIEKMSPTSVRRTVMQGAFLGLDFFMDECYAIPYGNKLQFQTDYRGERKIVLMYSREPIYDIYAKVVRKGEKFESGVKNGRQYLDHDEDGFSDAEIIGAYAIALYKEGYIRYEKMSKKEIEEIRDNFSKMPNGMMWTKTPQEAYKKTVMRRLCKTIETDFNQEQKRAYDEGSGMEFDNNKNREKESSPFDEDVIDADYEEVEEEDNEEELSDEEFAEDIAEDMEEDDD